MGGVKRVVFVATREMFWVTPAAQVKPWCPRSVGERPASAMMRTRMIQVTVGWPGSHSGGVAEWQTRMP